MTNRWEERGHGRRNYVTKVRNGFILTQGKLHTSLGGIKHTGFKGDVPLPCIHLLKVHRGHPFRVVDSGEFGEFAVRRVGEKRLLGDVIRDTRRWAYDSACLLLAPYNASSEDSPVKERVFHVFPEGTEVPVGEKKPLSLLYCSPSCEVDYRGAKSWASISPAQIRTHLFDWMYGKNEFFWYDKKNFGKSDAWKFAGETRLPLQGVWAVVDDVARKLEKRFRTRMFCRDESWSH